MMCLPDTNASLTVAVWAFCTTIRAEALSNIDGDALNEQAARGKSTLNAQNNPEAVSQWQQDGGGSKSESQGSPHVP